MAGSHVYRNPPLAGKDKLVGKAPIDDSGIRVISCAPTPAPPQTPAPVFTSAQGLLSRYMDENLQKATKLTLEWFVQGSEHGQFQKTTRHALRHSRTRILTSIMVICIWSFITFADNARIISKRLGPQGLNV